MGYIARRAAGLGGVQRRRARHHRDVVGRARRGPRRDPQDARPHRQAVRRQHRPAVRARSRASSTSSSTRACASSPRRRATRRRSHGTLKDAGSPCSTSCRHLRARAEGDRRRRRRPRRRRRRGRRVQEPAGRRHDGAAAARLLAGRRAGDRRRRHRATADRWRPRSCSAPRACRWAPAWCRPPSRPCTTTGRSSIVDAGRDRHACSSTGSQSPAFRVLATPYCEAARTETNGSPFQPSTAPEGCTSRATSMPVSRSADRSPGGSTRSSRSPRSSAAPIAEFHEVMIEAARRWA